MHCWEMSPGRALPIAIATALVTGCFDPDEPSGETEAATQGSTSQPTGAATTPSSGSSAETSDPTTDATAGPTTATTATTESTTGDTETTSSPTTDDSVDGSDSDSSSTGPGETQSCSRSIAFERDNDIWLVDVDTGDELNLSDHDSTDREFDWHPDGSELTFVSFRGGGSGDVYRVSAAGSVSAVSSGEVGPRQPQWSGDGDRIVYMVDIGNAFTGELVSLNPDGTGRMVHTPSFMWLYGAIDLNPEGDQVVNVEDDNNGNARLRYVDVPSANSDYVTGGGTKFDRAPRYSPNGSQIAFERRADEDIDVFVISPTGSGIVNLTDDQPAAAQAPRWSQDGTQLLYITDIGGNSEVFSMGSDGSNKVNLTNDPSTDDQAVWSPDALEIAFISDRGGSPDLWIMNADGSDPVAVTSTDSEDARPQWQPCSR